MRKGRFTEEQIIGVLKEAEPGRTIPHAEVADAFRRKWVLGATQ